MKTFIHKSANQRISKLTNLLIMMLISASIFAQAPQKMSYQAVIRNSSDVLVTNTQIGMEINIHQGSASGTVVYTETQTPTTNANGLVSIEIGGGAGFNTIDWSAGPYFIETKTDPKGGTKYTITGTSQLMSVPYALHAKTAETVTGGAIALTIGQAYQGGIIFWLDATGQHGLIAATKDQSIGIAWYNGIFRSTGTAGDGLYSGTMNTAMIIATQMADNQTGNFAAKVCADYSVTDGGVTYGDWYLPSKYELNLLYAQRVAVGGFAKAYYWSSTENNNYLAWLQYFVSGLQGYLSKTYTYYVRAVRAF